MKKALIIISLLITSTIVFISISNISYETNIENEEIVKLFGISEDFSLNTANTFREKSLVNVLDILLTPKKTYNNYVIASVEFKDEEKIYKFLNNNFYSSNISVEEYTEFKQSLKKHIKKYNLYWLSTETKKDYQLFIAYDCCESKTIKASAYYYCLKFEKKAIFIYDQSFLNL